MKFEEFFIVAQGPILETVAWELKLQSPYLLEKDGRPWSGPLEFEIVERQGIRLKAPFEVGLQLNYFMKTASRILWRRADFHCKEFSFLEKKLRQLDLNKETLGNFSLHITASKSRLNNEKRIAEVFEKVFGSQIQKQAPIQLFVRVFEDQFQISWDTSGEHLHKRGYRHLTAQAPLRETLASVCLWNMIKEMPLYELQKTILVDPMCGSGTFLFEAAQLLKPNQGRSFSFLQLKAVPGMMKSESFFKNYHHPMPNLFAAYLGKDLQQPSLAIEMAKNLPDSKFYFHQEDLLQSKNYFFEKDSVVSDVISKKRFVVFNPPYNERLKTDLTLGQMVSQAAKKYQPDRMAVLGSVSQWKERIQIPDMKLQQILDFENGGLPVRCGFFDSIAIRGPAIE